MAAAEMAAVAMVVAGEAVRAEVAMAAARAAARVEVARVAEETAADWAAGVRAEGAMAVG